MYFHRNHGKDIHPDHISRFLRCAILIHKQSIKQFRGNLLFSILIFYVKIMHRNPMTYNMLLDYIWRIKSINLGRLYTYNFLSFIQNLHLYMNIFAYLSLSLSYMCLLFYLIILCLFLQQKVEIVFKWVDVCLIDICCMLDSHSFIFTMIWI